LLHQDDWLQDQDALRKYIQAFEANPKAGFVFCKNIAVTEEGKEIVLQHIPSLLHRLTKTPLHLVLAQVIGPPSNTMLRIDVRDKVIYDEDLIWLVDVDYYARVLQAGYDYVYLDQHLVSIGLHEDQTTVFCRNNGDIILKENILFAYKIGEAAFKDIKIYDYYWRLLRNDKVKSIERLKACEVPFEKILPLFSHMIQLQNKVPASVLKFGPASKLLMFLNYLTRAEKYNSRMKLSVIIVNYRSAAYIINCIGSAMQFDSGKDFEWIVVDNASGDDSKKKYLLHFLLFTGLIWAIMPDLQEPIMKGCARLLVILICS